MKAASPVIWRCFTTSRSFSAPSSGWPRHGATNCRAWSSCIARSAADGPMPGSKPSRRNRSGNFMSAINYLTAARETPVVAARPEHNSVGAVIDIGSNSVKLLVGHVTGTAVEQLYSIGEAVRLGQGAFQTRRLRPDIIERVAGTVAEFARSARNFSPSVFRILATSAVREAVNRSDLVRAVETRAQKRVEIL